MSAWEVAKFRYAGRAIIAHPEQYFHDLIQGAVPMLLAACGVVLTTTILGGGVGSLFGGVGAPPGAAAGFAIGTTLLETLGLTFLAVYLKDRSAILRRRCNGPSRVQIVQVPRKTGSLDQKELQGTLQKTHW